MADNATLIIEADNAPNKFSTYYLSKGSTVIFNGTTTQHLALPGVVYGNLVFRNSGTKILYTPITVEGDLSLESGTTFDGGSNNIHLSGNWTNNGSFIPSSSTVVCTGTNKNITGNTTFNQLIVSGSYTIINDVIFNGLLNITSTGSLIGGSSINVTLNNNLINSGILYTLGTTTFTGNVLQTLSLINAVKTVAITVNFNGSVSPILNSTSVPEYGYLNINNTGGINPSVGWSILYSLNIGSGASFNGGVSTHNIYGSLSNNGTVTSNGILNFIPTSAKSINLGSQFSNTGTVVFGGSGAITLSGIPVTLNNLTLTNTSTSGINPSGNWKVGNDLTIATGAILNAGNYSHEIGGNIYNSGIINSSNSIFVINGSGIQDIYSTSAFANLSLKKNSGYITLSSNLNVTGQLTFDKGIINTSKSSLLIFGTNASIGGSPCNNSYINGPAAKKVADGETGEFSFPVGNSAAIVPYHPCGILPASISGGNTVFTAEYFSSPLDSQSYMGGIGLTGIDGSGYWDISNSSTVSTARVKVMYTSPGDGNWITYNSGSTAPFYDVAPDPCSQCNVAVVHRNSTTKGWSFTNEAGTFNSSVPEYRYHTDNGFIYSAVQNSFSPFSVGFAYSVILPVRLTAFTGSVIKNDGLLSWGVASTEDLSNFELQHGSDGKNFSTIATLEPAGKTYSYTDKNLSARSHFYRLHVFEKNGTSFYSQVVVLQGPNTITQVVGLLQNPVHTAIEPIIKSGKEQAAGVIISDASGRVMSRQSFRLQAGENKIYIPSSSLVAGIYFIQIITADGQKNTIRFLKN